MRKSQKRQIENTLELLDRAQEALKKAVETRNDEIALSLLGQCQDSAIQIGEMIEESFGEDFTTIGLLENYCEQIYQTYESIQQNRPLNANKTHKNLRKELIRIENSVKNDIQVRTTAVFLPYKASMWDSLESVWKAADEDPNCDAYVVPIPYFDKNPDESFREMHYEGNEYPKYVPITSWEEYDIAAEHPDIIFIHNPYDEFNHVTSVPPMYFSKELKNLTDLLVYIPYFVLGDIDPDDKEAVEKLEHFCTVPAVVYADKVIVQSKEWRQVYIDVMTQTMGNDTRHVWEKKILALGSPKMDKVHVTKKDDLDIPEEWLKIIEKPDGSWKKIIFYNTSVSALLHHGEKILEKMEYVFRFFRENQEEVALLWRPHPLIKATIESMRPQLWAEYEKLVKVYIEEEWGIYDDTADLNRAIALSDAYYGDHSSIVKMYEETGKPFMLQSVDAIPQEPGSDDGIAIGNILEKGKLHLQYRSGIRVKDKFYFSEVFFNGLFELDIKDFSIKFIGPFSEGTRRRMLWHTGSAVQYKHRIYFFPLCSRWVHYYDFVAEKEDTISIPISEDKEFLTAGTVQTGSKVWLFSSDASLGVFVLDMDEQSIIKDEILCELLEKYGKTGGLISMPETGKVFIHYVDDALLLEVDLEKTQIKEYRVSIDNTDIWLIDHHEGLFYFTDRVSGDLFEWALEDSYIQKYTAGQLDRIKSEDIPFISCCFVNGDVYVVPWGNKYVMKVKREEGIMERAFEYPDDFQYLDSRRTDYALGMMQLCEVVGDEIWFHPCGGNQLLIYNTVSGQITGRGFTVDAGALFPCEGRLDEYHLQPLDYFCYGIQRDMSNSAMTAELCGGKIYQALNE